MEELIKVTTDGQGSSVVSARDLHAFLEVKSRFNDWIKNRIIKYGFLEDRDYVTLTKNLVGGGIETDYALTLSMAKELSMVERNEKGKEARQYFIHCEETLRQVVEQPTNLPPTTEQVLLQLMAQSNQLLANQQQQLDRLRADVDLIMSGQRLVHAPAQQTPPSIPGQQLRVPIGGASLRQTIPRLVIEIAARNHCATYTTWNYLYKRLYEVYRISVYRLQRIGTESIVDAIERYGHLNELYSLIMSELHYSEE
jgi:phage anti-repressor protein